LIDLILTKISTFLVIVDKGGEVSHKDIERRKESKRYDIGKESIKIEHTSRGSKLMNHLLHLYVH
jgi:predicted GNAT family acetyltransferase